MKKSMLTIAAALAIFAVTTAAAQTKREVIVLEGQKTEKSETAEEGIYKREIISIGTSSQGSTATVGTGNTTHVPQKREVVTINGGRNSSQGQVRTYREGRKSRYDYTTSHWNFGEGISSRSNKVRFFDISGHWMGFQIGYSGLVKSLGNLSLPANADFMSQKAKSVNVNINFVNVGIISTRHFGLMTGLGMELNNFQFEQNVTITSGPGGYIIPDYSYEDRGVNLKKSKLSTNYFTVPLLVEYRTGRHNGRQFYVYGGVVGGWCFNAHTKVKYRENGSSHKDKEHNNLHIRNLKYGYTAGIGFSRIGIYASYYPESLFKAGKGPKVRQANIGLSFNFGRGVSN